jgi:hypothetical protein
MVLNDVSGAGVACNRSALCLGPQPIRLLQAEHRRKAVLWWGDAPCGQSVSGSPNKHCADILDKYEDKILDNY